MLGKSPSISGQNGDNVDEGICDGAGDEDSQSWEKEILKNVILKFVTKD